MQSTCPHCSGTFTIEHADLDFIERISPVIAGKKHLIPPPTFCPTCRRQRRFTHRNEKRLYQRTCAKTGKPIISIYSPDKNLVVFDKTEWWGDGWDAKAHAKDIDFSRPFFEQLRELQTVVPRMALQQENNQNSDYTGNTSHLKNCYLIFSADFDQDCAYGVWIERSKNCCDNLMIDECEQSYECFFSKKLYRCRNALHCSQCSDSAFLFDCRNCQSCLMCWGLRNKKHCIANVQYTKEEYEKRLKEFPLTSHKNYEAAKEQFAKLFAKAPRPAMRIQGTVIDSTGDLLSQCQNCKDCYELTEGKDCRYCAGAFKVVDAVDCNYFMGEFGYENCECFPMPQHSAFNMNSYGGSDLYYCDMCMLNCRDCFGCVGLKRGQYCILNKQYTKNEYEALLPRLIDHMTKTGEWGQYVPAAMSLYAYNESQAQEEFPLTKKDATVKGWSWLDEEENNKSAGPAVPIPDDISDIDDTICQQILRCEVTGKAYKIIPQELTFYRDLGIPIPRRCFDQRHTDRITHRNPRQLWTRKCGKCSKEIQSTYDPKRPEVVLCEECYLKMVY